MKTPSTPPQKPAPQAPPLISSGEVLHSETHSHLTSQEIAKAVARHKREHREPPSAKHS